MEVHYVSLDTTLIFMCTYESTYVWNLKSKWVVYIEQKLWLPISHLAEMMYLHLKMKAMFLDYLRPLTVTPEWTNEDRMFSRQKTGIELICWIFFSNSKRHPRQIYFNRKNINLSSHVTVRSVTKSFFSTPLVTWYVKKTVCSGLHVGSLAMVFIKQRRQNFQKTAVECSQVWNFRWTLELYVNTRISCEHQRSSTNHDRPFLLPPASQT